MSNIENKSVAIVVCAWPPGGGGIGNNAYHQAFKLAEIGYKVGVFTPYFKNIKIIEYPFTFQPLKTWCHWGKAGFMIGLLKKLKKYQIIHLYYPFFGSDILVVWLKFFNPKIKLIIHYQMDPIARGLKGLIFKVYFFLMLPLLIRLVDRVGILSYDHGENSYLKKYLVKYRDKFFELPNGVDTKIFAPVIRNKELMNFYGFGDNDRIIIFVGGLDDQHYFKGVPELLKAVSKLGLNFFPNVLNEPALKGNLSEFKGEAKVLIVGDGNLKSQFEALAKRLGLEKRVFFTGWIDNKDLVDYYSLSDIFVLPSTVNVESFGIVVAEAQSCELPVIVSNWPGVRKTLADQETGFLVEPGDVDDLTKKLKSLLADRELINRFGKAGRLRVISNYEWDKVISLLDKVYNEL
jgi:glycosyltransferase involved in cell wall biosynthesis